MKKETSRRNIKLLADELIKTFTSKESYGPEWKRSLAKQDESLCDFLEMKMSSDSFKDDLELTSSLERVWKAYKELQISTKARLIENPKINKLDILNNQYGFDIKVISQIESLLPKENMARLYGWMETECKKTGLLLRELDPNGEEIISRPVSVIAALEALNKISPIHEDRILDALCKSVELIFENELDSKKSGELKKIILEMVQVIKPLMEKKKKYCLNHSNGLKKTIVSTKILNSFFKSIEKIYKLYGIELPKFSVAISGSSAQGNDVIGSDLDMAILLEKTPSESDVTFFNKLRILMVTLQTDLVWHSMRLDNMGYRFINPEGGDAIDQPEKLAERALLGHNPKVKAMMGEESRISFSGIPVIPEIDVSCLELNILRPVYSSDPENEFKLFEAYIKEWHKLTPKKEILGVLNIKIGIDAIKTMNKSAEIGTLKELIRPINSIAYGLSLIYDQRFYDEDKLIDAYKKGLLPRSTEAILKSLIGNKEIIPKEIIKMVESLLPVYENAQKMRNEKISQFEESFVSVMEDGKKEIIKAANLLEQYCDPKCPVWQGEGIDYRLGLIERAPDKSSFFSAASKYQNGRDITIIQSVYDGMGRSGLPREVVKTLKVRPPLAIESPSVGISPRI